MTGWLDSTYGTPDSNGYDTSLRIDEEQTSVPETMQMFFTGFAVYYHRQRVINRYRYVGVTEASAKARQLALADTLASGDSTGNADVVASRMNDGNGWQLVITQNRYTEWSGS